MSTINVTNIKGKGGASPNLPDGANVTGVITATSFSGSGANLTGLANTAFINAEQVTVVGVVTAGTGNIGNLNITKSAAGTGATVGSYTGVTTYYGDGQYLSGVGASIAPWYYDPDVNDSEVLVGTGIGITFNTRVLAGSGTATLKIVNAGVAGTTIQSWGVSSCTFSSTAFTLGSLVSDLTIKQTYQVDIPSGFIVDSGGKSYAGTAYTFAVTAVQQKLFAWGKNEHGQFGVNDIITRSSPVQVPGTTWKYISGDSGYPITHAMFIRSDGTLWGVGNNDQGELGQNSNVRYSSPVQIPGTSWAVVACSHDITAAVTTDGKLYTWGDNSQGALGLSNNTNYSSPVRVGSETTWGTTLGKLAGGWETLAAIKTDGTFWNWGANTAGELGQNNTTEYNSPKQVPGTTWAQVAIDIHKHGGIKTNAQLWTWGKNQHGQLGQTQSKQYCSSPIQVPGTWSTFAFGDDHGAGVNTDGELFCWGDNAHGQLGQNTSTPGISSPIQVGSDTTWGKERGNLDCTGNGVFCVKTDGTLWGMGNGGQGRLQTASEGSRSSPVQLSSGFTDISQIVCAETIHQTSGIE